MSETRDQWMKEYGLPDACDPFPDLCTKVAALGGTRCEYYAAVAARAGWSISCSELTDECGLNVGCDYVGDAITGPGSTDATLLIVVDTGNSPAFVARADGAFVGDLGAGDVLDCDADVAGLICIIERIVHAEILVIYEAI